MSITLVEHKQTTNKIHLDNEFGIRNQTSAEG